MCKDRVGLFGEGYGENWKIVAERALIGVLVGYWNGDCK